MLFWIFIAILVGGIIWSCFAGDYSDMYFTSRSVRAIGIAGTLISLVLIMVYHIGAVGYVDAMHARHESLTYQLENDIYDNDNDIGKSELMNQVREWNEDLASNKALQDNFWIGIYIPNVYDQFEPIKLTPGGSSE